MFNNYLSDLIGKIYKILPMKENSVETLKQYLESLQVELVGVAGLVELLKYDSQYISVMAIIQYFISNYNNCDLLTYKREIFKCINLINKIQSKYIIL